MYVHFRKLFLIVAAGTAGLMSNSCVLDGDKRVCAMPQFLGPHLKLTSTFDLPSAQEIKILVDGVQTSNVCTGEYQAHYYMGNVSADRRTITILGAPSTVPELLDLEIRNCTDDSLIYSNDVALTKVESIYHYSEECGGGSHTSIHYTGTLN